VWYFGIKYATKYVFEPFISSQPWKDKWIDMTAKTFESAYFIKFGTKEETYEFACSMLAIISQHAVGGALCLPSMLGGSGSMVAALACHGGLCEAGWELQDAFERAYQILFGTKQGKAKNPLPLVMFHGMFYPWSSL
jgi:hypothetical protein